MAPPSTPQRQLQPFIMQSASPSAGPSNPPGEEDDGSEENIFRDMSFDEVLEDLNARFLANLPEEEMTLVRLYWQAEQAHWFYEDYLRPLNPLLPSLSQRQFTHLIIASSPLYANTEIDYDAVWEEYCAYKKMVPCCGGILINATGDKVIVVRGWKSSAGWCFPRGKINSGESEVDCAIREVEEETGFDLTGLINPEDFIKTQINAQEVTMFIVKGIDESTVFETQTRHEIGAIEWVPLGDLPTWTNKKGPKRTGGKGQKKFYNVTPFVNPLKKWLVKQGINPHPKKRAEGVPATRQRELQPFTFGDVAAPNPAAHAGHHHPTTALDHLFATFIQKDDNVTAFGSDNSRTLDQLFGGLPAGQPAQSSQQQTQSDDDALARLLGGLSTAPNSAALSQPVSKQSKLLAVLNKLPANEPRPQTPPQSRSHHQTNLLSMLSPSRSTSSNPAPTAAAQAVMPAAQRNSDPIDDERRNRQQALLQSLFSNQPGPVTPPGAATLRPQFTPSPASGMISPMPPMPPSQAYGWQPPPPSGLSGYQTGSPARQPPQTPPQHPHNGAAAHLFTQPPPRPPQQLQPSMFPPLPQLPPTQQFQQHSPPRPPVNEHQRALLGTLFNARPTPPNGQSFNRPPNNMPMGVAPNGQAQQRMPSNGQPHAYQSGGFPQFPGGMPQYDRPGPLDYQPQFNTGFQPPQQYMGGPGPQQHHNAFQGHQPSGPSSAVHTDQSQSSSGPAVPVHPAPQPQPLAPGSAVHQPVPRPPVGGGLLGLINGTSN